MLRGFVIENNESSHKSQTFTHVLHLKTCETFWNLTLKGKMYSFFSQSELILWISKLVLEKQRSQSMTDSWSFDDIMPVVNSRAAPSFVKIPRISQCIHSIEIKSNQKLQSLDRKVLFFANCTVAMEKENFFGSNLFQTQAETKIEKLHFVR